MCPRVKFRPQAKSKPQSSKLWILLVGVNQYQSNLSSLQYSALDCQGLGEALKDATASFADKEVIIHHDFVSQRPQLEEVRSSIQHIITSAGEQDTILFYFSGHGILETNTQQVALCLADTDTEQLLTTGLPLNDLLKQLTNCAASQQLVWLDACHSGGMTLQGTAPLADPSSQLVETLRHKAAESKGFYALLSCDRTQQSWEFPELGHGVFTYYLMRGLRGEAADEKGEVEADALYQYVYYQTLRYIDKTNQQIRLINQQKSSRGESKLQAEFPLQTPKRIVEGFGKVILGKRISRNLGINPRQALVVDGGFKANSTTLKLSQLLQSAGNFDLRYFPQTKEPWSQVKSAIATCLNARADSQLDIYTALLYLRGEVETTDTGESWLVLQDGIRISRFWLSKVLQSSRATQQIVILDCPGESSLVDWVEYLQLQTDRGQCLIAANAPLSHSQQFAEIVLNTLQSAEAGIELPVAAWISKLQMALAGTGIVPQIWLSGTQGVIEILTAKKAIADNQPRLDLGICPYMGLQAFDTASSEYFYGRESLVQKLLNHVSHQASLAVVGASGSGKSSAVQAGLIAQLKQGRQIPDSDRWWLGYFRPGSQPIKALAKVCSSTSEKSQARQQLQLEGLLYQGVEGFVRWLRTRPEPMVVLIIDQFEELFTLASEGERQEFIELILGALEHAGDRFKLVLTVRADFVAACLENAKLAKILQQDSILVPPYLAEADYRRAIVQPAKQVGLQVESGLVEVLLQDLDRSAGDLPLLQFALQQLWENRADGQLTLEAYHRLEGVKGALERQAQKVYDNLEPEFQACVRWIFLNLTQLGEGTEDTRRRITKSELIVEKYSAALIDKTLRILTDAKLIVVNLDSGDNIGQSRSAANPPEDDELFLEAMRQEATVEVVHEILIRHWSSLRWWLEENRSRLRSQRQIEQAAVLWLQKERQSDFLLQGVRLAEAEEIYIEYTDELSATAKEFVASCIDAREAEQRLTKKRLRQARLTAAALGILGLAATIFGVATYRQKLITQVENINGLTSVAEAQLLSNQQLESLITSVRAGKQLEQISSLDKVLVGYNWQSTKYKTTATLQQSIYGTQELNRLSGHSQKINAVKVSQDGKMYATASDDGTIKIWQQDGRSIKTLTEEQINTSTVAVNFSNIDLENLARIEATPDTIATESGSYTISNDNDRLVQFQPKSTQQATVSYPHTESVNKIGVSDDKRLLATTTIDGKINIWTKEGVLLQTLSGHTGEVADLKFVTSKNGDRYKLISAGVDKTARVWQVLPQSTERQEIYSIAVSPTSDNSYASAGADGKINIWHNVDGKNTIVRTFLGHQKTIAQIKYSPDGNTIASASWDKTVKLWNVKTGELVNTITHKDAVNTIAFGSDNKTLISGSEDNNIYLWDISQQPKLVKTLAEHSDSIKAVIVSPDGKLIASAGYDKRIKLWTSAGELLQTIDAHNLAITSLAFTADSQTLISASWDNSIKIWLLADEGKSSQLSHTLTGHQDGVTTIGLNADGTILASASGDRTIKLWDVETGELIKNLRGHTSQINSLGFNNNNKTIISGEAQQGLFQWNLDLDNLLVRGCDRLADYLATNPNVKPNERKICP